MLSTDKRAPDDTDHFDGSMAVVVYAICALSGCIVAIILAVILRLI